MTHRETACDWMVRTALAYLGTPYRWGGDDPSGFDCSGLIIECLRSAGLIEQIDLSADELYRKLRPHEIENPDKGYLVFWLNPSGLAYHVGLCLDPWYQISAGGGDRSTMTASDAWDTNAYVRIRPIPVYGPRCRFCDPLDSYKRMSHPTGIGWLVQALGYLWDRDNFNKNAQLLSMSYSSVQSSCRVQVSYQSSGSCQFSVNAIDGRRGGLFTKLFEKKRKKR